MKISKGAIAVAALLCNSLYAQNTPGTHQDNSGINGSLSHGDLEKLGGVHAQKSNTSDPRESAAARAKAKKQSAALIQSMHLSCDLSNAQLVIAGTSRSAPAGKEVETRVYEVACSGAMGYLIETQGTDKPAALSCLNAEEARTADVARGKEPGFFCKLPENADVYGLLASVISSGTGGSCAVKEIQSFGRSESTQSDYSEVLCKEGTGYLLRFPRPGSAAQSVAMTCTDAAKQGIKCKLTDSGPIRVPVTQETFKTGLIERGVACKIDQVRLIGQEDHLKRYVVEYLCADQPIGSIAYLPLAGNSNPYESIDCPAAVSRGLVCTLMAVK